MQPLEIRVNLEILLDFKDKIVNLGCVKPQNESCYRNASQLRETCYAFSDVSFEQGANTEKKI